MTASLFYEPRARPLSPSGAVMPLSWFTFWITNTTTLAPIYSDAELSIELENPLQADSAGRFPAIYLDPEIIYRVKLETAALTEVYDVDPFYSNLSTVPVGTIMHWYGAAEDLETVWPPALWQVCDGENGSPDMRNRSPVGVSSDLAVGETAGSVLTVSSAAGAHDHGGETGAVVLTSANMPLHNHLLYVKTAADADNSTIGFGSPNAAGLPGQNVADGPFDYVDEGDAGGGNTLVQATGEATPDGHEHAITEQADHVHNVDTQSPVLALYMLMRR